MTGIAYLIDTDWMIDHLDRLKPATSKRLRELEPQGLSVSIITIAELWEGIAFSCDRPRSEAMVNEFVENIRVFEIDERICQIFGQIRGTLRRAGLLDKTGISDLDLMIAATALRHNLTLLTNNRRHFENIEGLRIESLT